MCGGITSPLKIGRVCVPSHVAVLVIPGFGLRTTLEINSKLGNSSMNGRKYCEEEEKWDSLPLLNLSLMFSSVNPCLDEACIYAVLIQTDLVLWNWKNLRVM